MADLRSRIKAVLEDIDDEELRELVLESLTATKLKWGLYQPDPCKKCGEKAYPKKVQVDYPDLDKRAKILAVFADQSYGKPAETKKVDLNVSKPVSEMSDDELAAFAAGG